MTLLNAADAIYLGSSTVDKVYLGTVQVWPPTVSVLTEWQAAIGSIPSAIFYQTTGTRQLTVAPGVMINETTVTSAVPVTRVLDGLAGLTAAYSFSRALLTIATGQVFYSDSAGAIISVLEQTGSNRTLTDAADSTRRPAVATAGPNNRVCADFDGTSDYLSSSANAAVNFLTASSSYMIASVIFDAITKTAANVYDNHIVLGDSGGYFGIIVKNTGSPDTIYAYNNDAMQDTAASVTAVVDTPYVIEWRHVGGNIQLRVNMGSWITTASGNTTNLLVAFRMGGGPPLTSTSLLDGKVFEAAVFNTALSDAEADAVAADFMAWVGA